MWAMSVAPCTSTDSGQASCSTGLGRRGGEVVFGCDPDQFAEIRGDAAWRDRYFDLDCAGLAIDDPDRTKLTEQIHHLCVGCEHQRGECRDAGLASAIADHLEEQRADPAPLPVVDHSEGHFGDSWPEWVANVAHDADPFAGFLVECNDRLVVVVIDVGEIANH